MKRNEKTFWGIWINRITNKETLWYVERVHYSVSLWASFASKEHKLFTKLK